MSVRHIQPEMVSFLNQKLSGNGLFLDAIKRGDARTVFRLAAESCVGIREVGGNNCGPFVELIQRTIGGAEREAWCMSFVQTCLAYAERVTGIRSPVIASEHCLTVWNETPKEFRVKSVPLPGAIIIWRHGITTSGHTGITSSPVDKAGMFMAIEGNTESGVVGGKVERDGGGVYATHRSVSGAGTMRVLGFIKPF